MKRTCAVFIAMALMLCALPAFAGADTAVVPILMYHHFTVDPAHANGNCITADAFAAQLSALSEAGYHSVTVADCIDFVDPVACQFRAPHRGRRIQKCIGACTAHCRSV